MSEQKIIQLFKNKKVVLFDSAMGTALLAAGQPASSTSEQMNMWEPDKVRMIHEQNIKAGCDVITANTFGVTQMILRGEKQSALRSLRDGIKIAQRAAGGTDTLVCFNIGPTGALLGSLGDVSYETAEEAFAAQAEAAKSSGADFVLLETFGDLEEFLRAARAAIAASGMPVLGTMTFGESGRSYMGATPEDYVEAARAEGVQAVGANCSVGPDEILPVISKIVELAAARQGEPALPVIAQPNAGQPVCIDGKTHYDMTPAAFAYGVKKLLDLGISGIGGCCGTTPAMISTVRGMIDRS